MFGSKSLKVVYYQEKQSRARYLTWRSIKRGFEKKTSMSDPVKNGGYNKWCSLISPRCIKSISYSVFKIDSNSVFKLNCCCYGPFFAVGFATNVFQFLFYTWKVNKNSLRTSTFALWISSLKSASCQIYLPEVLWKI